MKLRTFSFLTLAIGFMFCLVVPYIFASTDANESAGDTFPAAAVPERNFEFEPVVDGEKVLHDFIIKNEGGAALHITRVKTG